ncbi:hypothetical protein [Antrihabitans spumae]|jgi:hypothetical protein|uniref:Uncharacterized protein n=1 Tax=Antrihabitans spumae TaxID=3373370 RepID=A0ABW7JN81_9NOCA
MASTVAATIIVVIGAVLLYGIFNVLRDSSRVETYRRTVRAIRPWMFLTTVVHIAVLLAAIVALLQVPFLSYGWWKLLGGDGNVLVGQTGFDGIGWQIASLVIPVGIFVLVPDLAYGEELMFRLGADSMSHIERLQRQVRFGIAHCLMGVPLAAGIALILSGYYYQAIYLRALRRLELDVVPAEGVPRPTTKPYPPGPSHTGSNDEAKLEQWRLEMARVATENEQRITQWYNDYPKLVARQDRQADALRLEALTTAAAAHTVMNWIVVSVIVTSLVIIYVMY